MIDVDNTLIRNDDVKGDVDHRMRAIIGDERTEHYWEVYEQVRKDMDGVDIPATLKRLEPEYQDKNLYRKLYRLWMDFPYTDYIYPGVFETLKHLREFAQPVILSDGDPSFQLRKIVHSGLSRAVDGNVLVYQHKTHHFEDIESVFPAYHYVMVEDKPTLLSAAKDYFEDRITTVLVMQGKYSKEKAENKPDLVLKSISDLQKFNAEQFKSDRF
jgi:FMN phosphatase YigB (HAD superfamily)